MGKDADDEMINAFLDGMIEDFLSTPRDDCEGRTPGELTEPQLKLLISMLTNSDLSHTNLKIKTILRCYIRDQITLAHTQMLYPGTKPFSVPGEEDTQNEYANRFFASLKHTRTGRYPWSFRRSRTYS